MPIISNSITHIGTVRTRNEDAILDYLDAGLWAIADGMGGHQAGDFASQCIIEHLRKIAELHRGEALVDNIIQALTQAHQTIYQHSQTMNDKPMIGSTIVVLVLEADNYHCFWSGDSRCYLLRNESLTAITSDHSEAQALRDAGDEMINLSSEEKMQAENTLVHAIGIDSDSPHIDYACGHIYEQDQFYLCSDGVNKIYSDSELSQYLLSNKIEEMNTMLIEQAPDNHIPDNLSSIIISI